MNLFVFGPSYSARRYIELHHGGFETAVATARSDDKAAALEAINIQPLRLDSPGATARLREQLSRSTHVIISAAPDANGDPALREHGEAFAALPKQARIAYLSTVGVYGDHDGAWVDETTPCKPVSARSQARLAAEDAWRDFATRQGINLHILRLAGIYGPGRSAIDNLRSGTARRIVKPGQVFNRIHVDDIAGAIAACFRTGLRQALRTGSHVWNVADDEPSPPQDVVDHAARLLGLEPPPEIDFASAQLSPMARSFYGENKRVSNRAMKDILGVRLKFPDYRAGLKALAGE